MLGVVRMEKNRGESNLGRILHKVVPHCEGKSLLVLSARSESVENETN